MYHLQADSAFFLLRTKLSDQVSQLLYSPFVAYCFYDVPIRANCFL